MPPAPSQWGLVLSRGQVKDYTSWVASMRQELQREEASWEPSHTLLRLRAHQWLRAELEAREELQQQATRLGQQSLLAAGTPTKEVGPLPMLPAHPVTPWAAPWPPHRLFSKASLGMH